MYLLGDFADRDMFKEYDSVVIKEQITREDLAKTKDNSSFQVINLDNKTFFDPGKNAWIKFNEI